MSNEQVHPFKSEAQQLLSLMIHSLYKNKEIFLRELVSNASDALDRRRFEALTEPSLLPEGTSLHIRIEADAEARELRIHDSGIGMSLDEVSENLGTIARSGTRAFMDGLSNLGAADAGEGETPAEDARERFIGQFGVGFYSSFMVAESVEVVTRRAGSEVATRWRSDGGGTYAVSEGSRDEVGTTITLKLREMDEESGLGDFADPAVIRRVVRKHSDFVTWPIQLRGGGEGEDEWATVNSMRPIWTRNPAEVEDEEYAEFYRHISHDWGAPLDRVRLKAEGTLEYEALVFIPEQPPFDLFYRDYNYGLQLYVNRVLIMERSEDLIPSWLRFVRGVVDSPDLSLNVSREVLQEDRHVALIRKRITRKVLDSLDAMQTEAPEKYQKLWDAFGKVITEGVATDPDHRERLLGLLRYPSTEHDGPTGLAAYKERMKQGQECIYFLTGGPQERLERSPHLEAFRARGIEVLLLPSPVDELMVGHVTEFDGTPMKSVGQGAVDLGELGKDGDGTEEGEAEEKKPEAAEETYRELLGALREALSEEVKDVRISARLTESAACLVGEEHDLSPHLRKVLADAGHAAPEQKRILELNPDHPVTSAMHRLLLAGDAESATRLGDYGRLVYGQALLAEGAALPDPVAFGKLVTELMVRAS